jgi:hypothetical protein
MEHRNAPAAVGLADRYADRQSTEAVCYLLAAGSNRNFGRAELRVAGYYLEALTGVLRLAYGNLDIA